MIGELDCFVPRNDKSPDRVTIPQNHRNRRDSPMLDPQLIAAAIGIKPTQVSATVELLDAGNTIPFIARYRKEMTGGLDEEQLRQVESAVEKRRALDERSATILASSEKQGKLTAELRAKIAAAAIRRVIVAGAIAYRPPVRQGVRDKSLHFGVLHAEKIPEAADEKSVYSLYYAYESRVDRLRPPQVLALNSGESEQGLKIHVTVAESDWQPVLARHFPADTRSPFATHLLTASRDAAERLLLPAIERDVRRPLTEVAEAHAT